MFGIVQTYRGIQSLQRRASKPIVSFYRFRVEGQYGNMFWKTKPMSEAVGGGDVWST